MPSQLNAAFDAAWKSAIITGCGVLLGFVTFAVAQGAVGSPQAFWGFVQAQWFPWAMANAIPPILRAIIAAMKEGS